MAVSIDDIPEIRGLHARRGLIRIPPETDVPLTARVRRLIDCRAFRRLARISQLGLVALVYPAAHHSRFEHSLGVYHTALLYLQQLARDERFTEAVTPRDAELFLVTSLLHDVGHWPFCHPLEDIGQPNVPRHELLAEQFVGDDEIATALREDWGIEPNEVMGLLRGDSEDRTMRLLGSLLSGPIDVDKMDYLGRDSLHAGVPYGRNFDRNRLISSLCLNEPGDKVALTEKGRTAAEMMVFARYVMFSEVYWHHTVRAATAMLQRAFSSIVDRFDRREMFRGSEQSMIDAMLRVSRDTEVEPLVDGLFGERRQLFKRLAQYSLFQQPDVYERLARRPYPWLVRCAEALSGELSLATNSKVAPEQVLIDAPPPKREIEIRIEILFPKEAIYRTLAEVSPVVQTLATKQFDDYVKRVRVFVAPEITDRCRRISDLAPLLHRAVDQIE